MEHDAVRQVGYIQLALSQNKRPTGFFLGAGCPLAVKTAEKTPLIPDVGGLTKIVAEEMDASPGDKAAWTTLLTVVREDKGDPDNVEYLLSYIRQLAAVAGESTVRGLDRASLRQLDAKTCSVISAQVDKPLPDRSSPYHNLAIWARSIRRAMPVHLFTTNYDLLIEQAMEESSTPYFDGFVGARQAFFDLGAVEEEGILPPRWARLWKIHGSLNWRLTGDGKRVVRSDTRDAAQSHLIYPSHLKYDQSRKMPYLAMLDRLKAFILQTNSILFISGYSFGDEHINDVIGRSLEANPTAQVFSFMYGQLAGPRYAKARECGSQLQNLSVLAEDGATIGRIEGAWKSLADGIPGSLPPGVITQGPANETLFGLGNFACFGTLLRYLTGEPADDAV